MPDRCVSVSRFIHASPAEVFAVLADPAKHPEIDGSGTVRKARSVSTSPLKLGDRFGMDMKFGVPYRIANTVVEFETDRKIAWAHFGKHRWRYELVPKDGGTEVTETFDWSTARSPKMIELMGYPKKHPAAMAKTLERLAAHVEK